MTTHVNGKTRHGNVLKSDLSEWETTCECQQPIVGSSIFTAYIIKNISNSRMMPHFFLSSFLD